MYKSYVAMGLLILVFSFVIAPFHISAQTPVKKAKLTPTPTKIIPDEVPTTGIKMTLSPVFINITTNPGVPVSSEFKVTNDNNIKEFFKLSLLKFKPDTAGENPQPIEIQPGDEFVKWIKFSENEFVIGPAETKVIKFTISPPQTAALGYYYGVQVSRIQEKKPNQSEAIFAGSALLPILMEVRSPTAKKDLEIVEFNTSSRIYEYVPAEFIIKVRNNGNIHIVPFGDIFIDQGSKKDIGIVQANEMRNNILPNSERVYKAYWKDGFPVRVPKKNGEGMETKWDFANVTKFRIGKYTAHAVMVYSDGKKDIPLEATVSFWVLPWKIMAAGLVVLILVLLGVKSTISSGFKKVRGR